MDREKHVGREKGMVVVGGSAGAEWKNYGGHFELPLGSANLYHT